MLLGSEGHSNTSFSPIIVTDTDAVDTANIAGYAGTNYNCCKAIEPSGLKAYALSD
jgi:hypothetical protein